jgi:cobalt/nickel transport system permease protein
MEGFLPIEWAVIWYLACIPALYVGVRKLEKLFKEKPEQKMIVAVSGAFIFVLSSLKLPSVTGSSSHPTGTGLGAILFGPSMVSVLAAIVLLFQAILLAHGGITTLGANLFSMGIVGPFVAYYFFKFAMKAKLGINTAAFGAILLSDLSTYVVTALQLTLAHPGVNVFATATLFGGIFAITQIPLSIAEAILLTIFFKYLSKTRPKTLGAILGVKIKAGIEISKGKAK